MQHKRQKKKTKQKTKQNKTQVTTQRILKYQVIISNHNFKYPVISKFTAF